MSRTITIALLAFTLVACSEDGREASFVSEAVASPANAPDYGWRVDAPGARENGDVKEYD